MYRIAKLPMDERKIIFQNAAEKMGVNAAIMENSLRVVNSKCTNEKNAHYENPFCTGRVFFRAGCHDYESASVSFHGPCVVDSEELIHCRNDSLLVFLAF